MIVYAVKHYWDNGLGYEDYRTYEETKLFSTLHRAESHYYCTIAGNYEGSYALFEWELDTQKNSILEYSPYINCTPENYIDDYDCEEYDDYDWKDGEEQYYDLTIGAKEDPANSPEAAWKYLELCESYDRYCREEWSHEDETPESKVDVCSLAAALGILDDLAEKFCEEYNTADTELERCAIMARYDKEFEKWHHSNSWNAYKFRLGVI